MRLRAEIRLALLDNLVWILLAVLFTASTLSTPAFLGMRNQLNILYQSTTLDLLVLSMDIVMMMGELDLSMEVTLASAPGVTILMVQQLSPGPAVRTFMTLALGVMVGFFNGSFAVKMRTNSFLLIMSSQIVMRGLVLFLVPFSLARLDEGYTFPGHGRIGSLQIAILALVATYITSEFIFRKTVLGRKFALTGGGRRAAYVSDINTDRVIICTFVLAGLLSAVAGLATVGQQNAVSNSMGEGTVMTTFADAIPGGCSFNSGMGKPVEMLGDTLPPGMIDNALNLDRVDINLVSATKGGLIFLVIILDRLRLKVSADIMHRENT